MDDEKRNDAYSMLFNKLQEIWEIELKIPFNMNRKDIETFTDIFFQGDRVTEETSIGEIMELCHDEIYLDTACHRFINTKKKYTQ